MEANQGQAGAKEERPRPKPRGSLVDELVDDFDTITLPDLLFLASGFPICSVFYWRRICRISNMLRHDKTSTRVRNRPIG